MSDRGPDRLAILGTGDLTERYLFPALLRLLEQRSSAVPSEIVVIGREELDEDAFGEKLTQTLEQHAGDHDPQARAALVDRLSYHVGDATDADALGPALEPARGPLAVYLALPPAVFEPAIAALGDIELHDGSTIAVEKPFGEDLASARRLNATLARRVPHVRVHRVDHFLAQQTAQNILGLRFANRVFEPLWNQQHVERVEIVWDETLTLEGRAGYYDSTGALRDMVQNHLLQLLTLIAMEPPTALNPRDLRDRKVDVLRAVRPLGHDDVATQTRRGRYSAGRIGDRQVADYVAEPDVDPDRETETFAAVTLFVDNWRWSGVPFHLRSGKALAADRHEVAIHFRPVPHLPFLRDESPRHNVLRLSVDPDTMTLETAINGPGDPFSLDDADLQLDLAPQDLPAYARVLLDVFRGDTTFSIRGDEAEEAWRIVDPIVECWEAGVPALHEYPAGAAGLGPEGDRQDGRA